MSHSTTAPPKEKSLWDTLSGHANNLFEKSKKLASQATDTVTKATAQARKPAAQKPATTPLRMATASPSGMTRATPPMQRPVSMTRFGGKRRRTKRHKKRTGHGKRRGHTKRRTHTKRRGHTKRRVHRRR